MSILDAIHGRYIHRRRVRVLTEKLAALIPKSSTVLDLGCGDGLLARALLDMRPDLSLRGMDVFPRPGALIPVEVFDGVRIPLSDQSVDVVTIVDVLHHTNDPAMLLTEAARVAKKMVVLKDHLCEGKGDSLTLSFMDWIGNARHGVSLPYNYLPRVKWDAAFRSAGLKVFSWESRLGVYPAPLSWVFERSLHFVAGLVPENAKPDR